MTIELRQDALRAALNTPGLTDTEAVLSAARTYLAFLTGEAGGGADEGAPEPVRQVYRIAPVRSNGTELAPLAGVIESTVDLSVALNEEVIPLPSVEASAFRIYKGATKDGPFGFLGTVKPAARFFVDHNLMPDMFKPPVEAVAS